ncbi:cytochrome P450 [Musa troglodytarum]|uniref:Cytochrome P450 n=1 Tax=Musa troglodytarum TaxID=320322 RepID=A0A9E7FLL9_9LILI|nr:cytochrome P450 [Musa troglodytarum]
MDFFSSFPALAAASVMLALILLRPLLRRCSSSVHRRKPNYPPIAGTIFHQLLNLSQLADFQTDLSRKYRTFRILTPFCNYVFTVDPANVEHILKTNFANYGKGSFTYDVMCDFFGDGIFAVDGEKWRHQRKLASFEFSTKVLRDGSSVVFRSTAARLAKIISNAASSNEMIEIQDLLMKSTWVWCGVGYVVRSSDEGRTFAEAFNDASAQIVLRFFYVFWKVKRFLNIGSEAKMKKSLKSIDDFVFKLIDTKIEQLSQRETGFMEKEDILSRFLIEREKDPDDMSYKYLRDIILNFVIAGRDTTAGTLSWFFYMLCKHPNVQEKVAQEVREATKIKGEVTIDEFVASLTEEALNEMQYLHASLTETLRLYPAVPLDVKQCFSEDTLPDGFDVKKGDLVIYQPYPMGRMQFLWGEDAADFRPERWLNGDGVFVPESPFKFPAFQAGPRICLGKEFAFRQMKIFAATLLCFFKFKMWEEMSTVRYRAMITLQIYGLHLAALHRRGCLNAD